MNLLDKAIWKLVIVNVVAIVLSTIVLRTFFPEHDNAN